VAADEQLEGERALPGEERVEELGVARRAGARRGRQATQLTQRQSEGSVSHRGAPRQSLYL
jgi:hypothetical protein